VIKVKFVIASFTNSIELPKQTSIVEATLISEEKAKEWGEIVSLTKGNKVFGNYHP
jgi:hypothetical protein